MPESPSKEPPRREIPRDSWGMMQRVYGLRHSLLWPGQFAMSDLFKFITAWCIILSLLAVIVRLFWRH
jgi:hypothetical protein